MNLVKYFLWTFLVLLFITLIADQFTPKVRLSVLKVLFEYGGKKANQNLEKFVPEEILSIENINYKAGDQDAFLDLYFPSSSSTDSVGFPLIVWVHGGGWFSGSKTDLQNYSKILASKGFAVAAIEYTLAPKAHYPTQLIQIQDALQFLTDHAEEYGYNPEKIALAGDSAGAQLVAQTAAIMSNSDYANWVGISPSIPTNSIKATILYCGVLKIPNHGIEGAFKAFLHPMLWALSGTKNYEEDPDFQRVSFFSALSPAFPPTFISVGNGDFLRPHSFELAYLLKNQGVRTETLFFPEDHQPILHHEYQLNLDLEEAKTALERSVSFLREQF